MTPFENMQVGDVACCCGWRYHVDESKVLSALREHIRKCHSSSDGRKASPAEREKLLTLVKEIVAQCGGTVIETS